MKTKKKPEAEKITEPEPEIEKKTLNLELEIEKITASIAEILRRLDSVERYLELIYKDRELINEAKSDVAGLKQRVVDQGSHVENVVKKSQFEIGQQMEEIKDVVEDKVEEAKTDIVAGITGKLTNGRGVLGIFKKK